VTEEIHPVGLGDMSVEGGGIELRQDEDSPDVCVKAVADRNVDQPIVAANRDGRLRALRGEREEAQSLASAQDDGEHVAHRG
jgi:hypothetical protein